MKKSPITEIKIGDILGEHLYRSTGTIMLPKGTAISKPILARLKKMKITELSINSNDDELNQEYNQQLSELDQRFLGHENDPIMMIIKDVVTTHAQRNQPQPE